MRNGWSLCIVAWSCVAAYARPPEARQVRFLGPHPIAAHHGGGYCYIEAPHLHSYPPDHPALYQEVGNQYVFTGDPTPFGYDGERHKFYGHHPVATVEGRPVYCYLNGPHFHAGAPEGKDYRVKGDVAFYVGPFSPDYVRLQPHRERAVNVEYQPFGHFRPVAEVPPPPEWHGQVYVAPPSVEIRGPGLAVAAPGIAVAAPGVFVAPPRVAVAAPGVFVEPPGVIVGGPRLRASAPGVVVRAHGGYVAPGVVVVGPERGHFRKEERREWRGHHDNGHHRGWFK